MCTSPTRDLQKTGAQKNGAPERNRGVLRCMLPDANRKVCLVRTTFINFSLSTILFDFLNWRLRFEHTIQKSLVSWFLLSRIDWQNDVRNSKVIVHVQPYVWFIIICIGVMVITSLWHSIYPPVRFIQSRCKNQGGKRPLIRTSGSERIISFNYLVVLKLHSFRISDAFSASKSKFARCKSHRNFICSIQKSKNDIIRTQVIYLKS